MKPSLSKFRSSRRKYLGGATLVVAMIALVLVAMIGVAAINTSSTQFKLAGNLQFEDGAMNNAETAVATAENWISSGTNYQDPSFTTASVNHLLPATASPDPLTMTWNDSNSLSLGGGSQRYFIQQLSTGNVLTGSSLAVGGRVSTACNKVNTYQVTGRGGSARGAVKIVQTFYTVLSC